MEPVLSTRALNRTLLDRQFLLDPDPAPTAYDVVHRLVAVQAQDPNWAYLCLRARNAGFRHDDLAALLDAGTVVRCTAIRVTQHLVTTEDYAWLRPTLGPLFERAQRMAYFTAQTTGLAAEDLDAAFLELLAEGTVPRRTIARGLAQRFPGRAGTVLSAVGVFRHAVVHPPPAGAWGSWRNRPAVPCARYESWSGRALDAADPARLVRRYLAAFGPASVADLQKWSGLTRLREVVEGLAGELRAYRGESGTTLYDLADGVLVDPDTPAPVRFLAKYDNAVLGHADKSRIVPEAYRTRVTPGHSLVRPTVLVDGHVAATWDVAADGGVGVEPCRPFSAAEAAAVDAAAAATAAFLTAAP